MTTTIAGVPEELLAKYNDNPHEYDLLGVMADAADENGESVVAEALRWLWVQRRSPQLNPPRMSGWAGKMTKERTEPYFLPVSMWDRMRDWQDEDTSTDAIIRVVDAWIEASESQREEWKQWKDVYGSQ